MAPKLKTTDQTKLLTSAKVAEMLGVSEWCLRNWRYLGTKGPKFIKLGERFVRYRQSDVEEWVESHTRTPVETN